MIRRSTVLAAVLAATPVAAHADVYADDLTRCVVQSATPEDRLAFVRWMFTAMASHPGVVGMSTVTDEQRTEASRTTALLLQRLLLTDCRAQAALALKYEGAQVIEQSFGMMGQVAMTDLMAEPAVSANFDALNTYLDMPEWERFIAEVGGTPSEPSAE